MQLKLSFAGSTPVEGKPQQFNANGNKLNGSDRAFHDWYRFVLSFPPHLVDDYISRFELDEHSVILDPFCGTGTTLVQSRLAGIAAAGLEANPFAHFACGVKLAWAIEPDELLADACEIGRCARSELESQGIDDDFEFSGDIQALRLNTLDEEATRLLIGNSISPLPLHKVLILREHIKKCAHKKHYQHAMLALAKTSVSTASNLNFGPEVGVGKIKQDAPVIGAWLAEVQTIADDIAGLHGQVFPESQVYLADARTVDQVLDSRSISAVITSPPYPNEKDYTRTTRLESVILEFINSREDLRQLKKTLVRSNTRGVYKDDDDDKWIAGNAEIERVADAIEQRRIEMGKTSGFERNYRKVTLQYFGGMARHLAALRTVLRPGARLAYVVGDQASYLRVMIRTSRLLAGVAQNLGYRVESIDLFRTRLATATKEPLREEVLVLNWPG